MARSPIQQDVMFRFDEQLTPEQLAERKMLDRALNAGNLLAAAHAGQGRLDFRKNDSLLATVAQQELKKENVGVVRSGIQFMVRPEAMTAFVRAYRNRLEMADVKRSHEPAIVVVELTPLQRQKRGWSTS